MKKNLVAIAALTISAILFAVPLLLRLKFQEGLLFGEESYSNLLISQNIASSYGVTPFHLAVSALGQHIVLEVAAQLLPIIFGALSALLFYLIVRKLEPDFSISVLALLVFSTIPATMYVFSAPVPDSMALLLVLFGFYLSLFKSPVLIMLSLLAAFSLLLFGSFPFLLSIVLIVSSWIKGRNKQLIFISFLFLVGIAFWVYGIASPSIDFSSFLSSIVADLGGLYGIGLFHLMLTVTGIIILWPHRLTSKPMYFSAIFILGAFGIFGSRIILYSVFLVAFFSAVAIRWLANFKWESGLIKRFTIVLVACSLLFSTVSYLERISSMEPTPQLVSGLDWLRQQPKGIVLSDPSNTFWIQYFAGVEALAKPGENDANISRLFASRSLQYTNETLYSSGVKYIWIDPSMKSGKVWAKPEEGMLFLFRSNVTFLKLDERFGIETWEYVGGR
ncbi:MAG: hypothetical protein V1702_01390 [Candidatus Woesearchaeota archaeon]